MDKLQSGGDSANPLNIIVIDQSDDSQIHNPFQKLRKYSGNLFNQEPFEDDQFKLPEERLPKGVIRKRLRDIYPKDTPIGEELDGQEEEGEERGVGLARPSYLCELRMLPQWHYLSLIEPRCINQQGYYHVAVVQGGRIAKLVIDDFVYYDQARGEIQAHPFLQDRPWVHIILKAWAKLNHGYDRMDSSPPFSFLKAFSFPDWGAFNPGLEDLQTVISRISASNKNEYYLVCKTKSDPVVGLFGLVPNSAGYLITGYHQEYGNVFLKVKSYAGGSWNGSYQDKDYQRPTEHISLSREEFIIPLRTFINIFHLIYFTTNKYSRRHRLHYNKYTLSLDARQSKATFIRLQLLGGDSLGEQQTNISFHFPSVKVSDYGNPKVIAQGESCPPSVKICIGRLIEQVNLEGSLSYAQSLRENILKNQQGYFLNPANSKYEHVWSDYFTGYSNDATYHLKLRPGKYIIRLKVEKLLPQYRALLNITSSADSLIGECKMNKREQTTFLSEVLSNRARKEQRNVIQPFPHKKQSWIMANDDFEAIGYGTLTFQTGKNDNILMVVSVDTKKLKQGGYRIKDKLELQELSNQIRLKQGQSVILILKRDVQYRGEWQWPPEGITISYEPVTPKNKHKTTN